MIRFAHPLVYVFLVVSCYFFVVAQGLVLWDDDYGLWQRQLIGVSWWQLLTERLLSPFPYNGSDWGFTERGLQLFVYKILFAVTDSQHVVFFVYKSLSMGALGAAIWFYMQKLEIGFWVKAGALLLLFTAPNTIAAFTWYADFAPTAEFLYALCLLLFIELASRAPIDGLKSFFGQRELMLKWLGLTVLVYISYKSKANLKLIPVVFAAVLVVLKPRLVVALSCPLFMMFALAVPWSVGTFTKLPPWFPGSGGSSVNWMYQESGGLAKAYQLVAGVPNLNVALSSNVFYPLSLVEVLGFFLLALVGLVLFTASFLPSGAGSEGASEKETQSFGKQLAIVAAWMWFLAELAGSTALADINYFFRIRYTFILLVPFTLLCALLVTFVLRRPALRRGWVYYAGCIVLVGAVFFQVRINFQRGLLYRSSLGGVMVSIDAVYRFINKELPQAKILVLPGFMNYASPQDSSPALKERTVVGSLVEAEQYAPGETYGIAWGREPIAGFTLFRTFTGCTGPQMLQYQGNCDAAVSLYKRTGAAAGTSSNR